MRKWAIGIGIDSVVQCKDALQSVVNSLILFLFTGVRPQCLGASMLTWRAVGCAEQLR